MFIVTIIESIFMSLIMIGAGVMCKNGANDNPQNGIGYKTKLSRKNADTWKEANKYGGNVFIMCGALYIVLTLMLCIVFYHRFNDIIAILLDIGIVPVILIGICVSEIHLRSIFDKDGNRKMTN